MNTMKPISSSIFTPALESTTEGLDGFNSNAWGIDAVIGGVSHPITPKNVLLAQGVTCVPRRMDTPYIIPCQSPDGAPVVGVWKNNNDDPRILAAAAAWKSDALPDGFNPPLPRDKAVALFEKWRLALDYDSLFS